MSKKNIVLSMIETIPAMAGGLKRLEKKVGYPLKGVTLVDVSEKDNAKRRSHKDFKEVYVDFDDPSALHAGLLTIRDNLLLATCRADKNIPYFAKAIPFISYVHVPTVASLLWSTDKLSMRRRFTVEDSSITPRFLLVENASPNTISDIEKTVGYPVIIKPARLMSSLLIQECSDRESLENALKDVFERIQDVHNRVGRKDKPVVLVEERMIGALYSIDSYVDHEGAVYHCPPCSYVDGMQAGYNDFFLYNRKTPADELQDSDVRDAEAVVEKGIRAMGLRSTTCHSELIQTDKGWKIIEIGPRVGRYRDRMYSLGFGIDHTLNDMLIRLSIKPEIPTKTHKKVAAYSFYPKNEGVLKEIRGLDVVENLSSTQEVTVYKKPGYQAKFARNGGEEIVGVVLANSDAKQLDNDIAVMESRLELVISDK